MPVAPAGATPLEDEPAIGQAHEKSETSAPPFWRRPLPVALVSACAALLLGVFAGRGLRPASAPAPDVEPKPIVRFVQTLPPGVAFRSTGRPVIALSPDGSSFVFNTTAGLFLRKLSELNARVIPGTEQTLSNPVFSPDGQSIAFLASGLRKTSVNGGASLLIGPPGIPGGINWETDGSILYGLADGIWRVPADGRSKPEQIVQAEPDEQLSAPQLLPGGKHVLFSSNRAGTLQVEARSLAGGERRVLVASGRSACYLPATGHLLFVVESDLFGVALDLDRLATIGSSVSLVQSIRPAGPSDMAHYAVSRDGTLLYLTGGADRKVPVWVDRQGKEQPLKLEPGEYVSPRLSPDGAKLAMGENAGGKRGYVVWDLVGETRIRLTQSGAGVTIPLWTPDSLRIVYGSFGGHLLVQPANNTRPPEVFMNAMEGQRNPPPLPLFFTADGRKVFFVAQTASVRFPSDPRKTRPGCPYQRCLRRSSPQTANGWPTIRLNRGGGRSLSVRFQT
ncbi:MAG: hypothetical protein FJ399_20650 [Verrucomicrobia bacterium]|nr:hypothetical protein [Verrucomicrobiota bacterium]